MKHWPKPLPVASKVKDVALAARVQKLIDALDGGNDHGITIGRRGRPPRVLVFTGRCSEKDVERIRHELKRADSRFEASLVEEPDNLFVYNTATKEYPDGFRRSKLGR